MPVAMPVRLITWGNLKLREGGGREGELGVKLRLHINVGSEVTVI